MNLFNSHQAGQSSESSKVAASNIFEKLNKKHGDSEGGAQFSSLFDTLSEKFADRLGSIKDNARKQSFDNVTASNALQANIRNERDNKLDDEEDEEKENKRKVLDKKARELQEQQQMDSFAEFNQVRAVANFSLDPNVANSSQASGGAVSQESFLSGSGIYQESSGTLGASEVNDPKQQASNKMAEISDDSLDLKEDLTKMNRHQLSNIDSEEDPSSQINRLNNKDLRTSLDQLARENNVSKLSLQMKNPQAEIQAQKDAQALANLPTSKDNLNSLTSSSEQQGQLLNQLNETAANKAQDLKADLTKMSTNDYLTKRQNRLEAQQALNKTTTTGFEKNNTAQNALLQMATDPREANMAENVLREFNARNDLAQDQALNPNKTQSLSQAISSLQSTAKGANLNRGSGITEQFTLEESTVADDGESILAINENNGAMLDGDTGLSESFSGDLDNNSSSAFSFAGTTTSVSNLTASRTHSQSLNFMNMHASPEENASEIHEKVMAMSARNLKHLTVELSPNELGKMKISIDLSKDNDALSVSLAAANPSTREALSVALPKLQDILMQQNIQTDAQVYDLNEEQQDGQFAQDDSSKQQQASDQEQEKQSLMQGLFGTPKGGTFFAKTEESGVIADNLTEKNPRQNVSDLNEADGQAKTGLDILA